MTLGLLRWSPDAVWRATPREVAAAFRPVAPDALARADLERLIRQHPDLAVPEME